MTNPKFQINESLRNYKTLSRIKLWKSVFLENTFFFFSTFKEHLYAVVLINKMHFIGFNHALVFLHSFLSFFGESFNNVGFGSSLDNDIAYCPHIDIFESQTR